MRSASWYLGFLILLLPGCSSGDHSTLRPHTHLSLEGDGTNIWTYEKVARQEVGGKTIHLEKHMDGKLRSGEVYTLANGTTLKFDGEHLLIGEFLVPKYTLNVFVEADGSAKLDMFIRTFD